jgi:hypothetical protein
MSETSQLDRVRSLARAVAADVGIRPRAAGRIRKFTGSLNIWFWAIVGLPTLVAGVYYFAIASDLYLSEAKFIVRSPKQVQTSSIGALIQSTGLARAVDDTAVVEDFIMSFASWSKKMASGRSSAGRRAISLRGFRAF